MEFESKSGDLAITGGLESAKQKLNPSFTDVDSINNNNNNDNPPNYSEIMAPSTTEPILPISNDGMVPHDNDRQYRIRTFEVREEELRRNRERKDWYWMAGKVAVYITGFVIVIFVLTGTMVILRALVSPAPAAAAAP